MSSQIPEPQHWHNMHHPRHTSSFEAYTGADSLIGALQSGWEVEGDVTRVEIWRGAGRLTTVYRFTLRSGDERRILAVVCNPYVTRFISANHLQVVADTQRDTVSV